MMVLLTGATGYIGRRLMRRLLEDPDVQLRLLVRDVRKVPEIPCEDCQVVEGDILRRGTLDRALEGIDTAYYLVHSLGSGADFERLDRIGAENFRDACIAAGVKRIIYLGGLGVRETASPHLRSRIETGEILSAFPDRIQTFWFRAGIIIGSGSVSFEIIRNLVYKLPIMITPRWVDTRTQPVFVTDVIDYLIRAKDLVDTGNIVIDLGMEPMSFREMMSRTAKIAGLKRYMVPVPFLTPRLSSLWLILFTPVPYPVASALIEGLRSETVALNDNARRCFPSVAITGFDEAVRRAFIKVETNDVVSRWCDSGVTAVCDLNYEEELSKALYRDQRVRDFGDLDPERVFAAVKSLGGIKGWYTFSFLWEIRGIVDKLLGGYGISRGRRDPRNLRVGDKLDFWAVADIKEGRRLLLEAQMKVPGRAWLEFVVEGHTLVLSAYFYPKGLWGKIYWYFTAPFHLFVFNDLVAHIIKDAEAKEEPLPR